VSGSSWRYEHFSILHTGAQPFRIEECGTLDDGRISRTASEATGPGTMSNAHSRKHRDVRNRADERAMASLSARPAALQLDLRPHVL
jgi:hypothetical protein